jgi:predicted nucleic acid-binding protein
VIAPDTSVLIAGFDSTHPFFAHAETALADVKHAGRLVAHTMAETFAVLSAPAGPYPALPADVLAYLEQFLEREPIGIPPRIPRRCVRSPRPASREAPSMTASSASRPSVRAPSS